MVSEKHLGPFLEVLLMRITICWRLLLGPPIHAVLSGLSTLQDVENASRA